MNDSDDSKMLAISKKSGFRLPSTNPVGKDKEQSSIQGQVFRMHSIVDKSKVKLGGQSPVFRK